MSIAPVPRIAVIVVAAGSGVRLGAGEPKAFVGIDDDTVLRHALRGVFDAPSAQVVVVAPADRAGDALTEAYAASGDRRDLVSVVVGGSTRQESVAAGLRAVWPDVEIVLVHDAARALTPPVVFDRVIAAVEAGRAGAIPVLQVVNTLKRVVDGAVVAAVDREGMAAAQTPQGFRRDVLDAAYRHARRDHTDDAALVAEAGHAIAAVDGDARAFKITGPADLARARALIAEPIPHAPVRLDAPQAESRVGIGTDVHAFGGDGALWLAGIEWPGEPALSGHSDGDAVAHAVVDALLSAAGLGDIGSRFGTSHPEFSGAHAAVFLAHTLALLGEAGWRIAHVSVQLQADRPKLAPRRDEAQAALSAALGGAPVSVSATTTDGLGFTGRGEGVAAFAVALLVPAASR